MSRESVMMVWYNSTTPKPTPQNISWITGDSPEQIVEWLSEGQETRLHAYPPRDTFYVQSRGQTVDLTLRTCTCGIQYWHNIWNGANSHNCKVQTIWERMYRKDGK